MSSKPLAVIAGVGPGTGAAIAQKFSSSYSVAVLARSPQSHGPVVDGIKGRGGKAIGINTDVSDATSVRGAFDQIAQQFPGSLLAAAVFNVGGSFIRKPFLEMSEEDYVSGFASNGRGAFHFSQAAIPLLLKATKLEYPPTLIFTGATASLKGSAQCSSFASGKFALRALTQSLAREFGPQGVHVSHVIIDGVINTEKTKHYGITDPEGKISPQGIADQYWNLHTQPRTALTFEMDLRPYAEKW